MTTHIYAHTHTQETSLVEVKSAMRDADSQAKARAAHDAKTISSLETQLREAHSHLEKLRSVHEQELAKMTQRAEEEKRALSRINESAVSHAFSNQHSLILGFISYDFLLQISKLRSQLDGQRTRLKAEHKAEIKKLTDKVQYLPLTSGLLPRGDQGVGVTVVSTE